MVVLAVFGFGIYFVDMNGLLVLSSYIADIFFGDPHWMPHPVKAIGRLISFLEPFLRSNQRKWFERLKGIVLAVIVVGLSGLSVYLFIVYAEKAGSFWGKAVWIFFGCTALAGKDLYLHGRKVLKKLKTGDLKQARVKLSLIVGRDTRMLSKGGIVKASIESIAENTNDGIIAPLFYLFLGGPVLAICYKAVSTLDSMVGYKNEKYIHFGWASAWLDDLMNFIPARITGILISLAAFLLGKKGVDSFRLMLRDGRKHSSPNSAVSEAAMAGALGIRLGGPCFYQGKYVEHLYIGEAKRPIKSYMIQESLTISFLCSFLMITGGILTLWML